MRSLFELFSRTEPNPEGVKVVHNIWEHQIGWGHNIEWLNWDRRRISGHHPDRRRFKVGDEMHSKMESGKIARFEIVSLEFPTEPDDMFLATLKDIGYVE